MTALIDIAFYSDMLQYMVIAENGCVVDVGCGVMDMRCCAEGACIGCRGCLIAICIRITAFITLRLTTSQTVFICELERYISLAAYAKEITMQARSSKASGKIQGQ